MDLSERLKRWFEMRMVVRVNAKLQAKMPRAIREAHKHSFRNRIELLKSNKVGCFYCFESFMPSEIYEWHDEDQTGFCPKCGIDALLGSESGFPIEVEFLKEMHSFWF